VTFEARIAGRERSQSSIDFNASNIPTREWLNHGFTQGLMESARPKAQRRMIEMDRLVNILLMVPLSG
jgi:hypothetical protein